MKKYRFGFDPAGLTIFLLIMLPNIIWFALACGFTVCRLIYGIVDFIA